MAIFFDLGHLEKYSRNKFIINRFSENEEKVYDYGEILTTSRCLLDELIQIGLKRNRVCVQCLQSPELCIILLSVLNSGCSFCGIPPNATANECINEVQKYDASFCITYISLRNTRLKLVKEICILRAKFYIFRISNRKKGFKTSNECYAVTTSGSTGMPKVVRVPYQCILPNIESLSDLLHLSSEDIILFASPITFDPFVVEFFLALWNGASLLIVTNAVRIIPLVLADVLQPKGMRGVSIMQMTPSLFRQFGSKIIQQKILSENSSVRILLLGGECFPSKTEISEWTTKNNFRTRIFNIYGITEVSCWSSLCEIGKRNIRERIPIGLPIDSKTVIRLVNKLSEPVNEGFGEIQIGSHIRKCLIDGDSSETIFSTDMLFRSTSDIGYISKGIIYFEGRKNETVKRYGQKVNLGKVSRAIYGIEGVQNNYCFFDEQFMRLICFVIKDCKKTAKEIRRKILTKLEIFEKPDDIEFVDYLPLTPHGKVSEEKLLNAYNAIASTSPKKIFERFITNVLHLDVSSAIIHKANKKSIQLNPLNISFLHAGGTSFQALTLATQIENVLQRPERKLLEMMLNETTKISYILDVIGRINYGRAIERIQFKNATNVQKTQLLKIKWQYDTGKCVDAAPRCNKNVVCVGSHSRLLVTLDHMSGREISSCILPNRIECAVSFVSSNLVLVGCYDGILYAVDYLTGKIIWSIRCGGMVKAMPLKRRHLVVVGSYSETGNLICFNLKTRRLCWKAQIGSKGIYASPTVVNRTSFIICTLSGEVACILFDSGHVLWSTKFESPIFSTPALLSKEKVVIAEVSGEVHCLDVNSGLEAWKLNTGGNIFSGVVVNCVKDLKYIFFGNHDHNVYCFQTGPKALEPIIAWKTILNSAVYSTPAILHYNEIFGVIASSTKGSIYLLDYLTGSKMYVLDLGYEIFSSPFIDEKRIFIGCRNNNILCIELQC